MRAMLFNIKKPDFIIEICQWIEMERSLTGGRHPHEKRIAPCSGAKDAGTPLPPQSHMPLRV